MIVWKTLKEFYPDNPTSIRNVKTSICPDGKVAICFIQKEEQWNTFKMIFYNNLSTHTIFLFWPTCCLTNTKVRKKKRRTMTITKWNISIIQTFCTLLSEWKYAVLNCKHFFLPFQPNINVYNLNVSYFLVFVYLQVSDERCMSYSLRNAGNVSKA